MPGLRLSILVILLLAPRLALAQSDDGLAKQYYKLGEVLYNRADHEGALKQFQKSYEISKKPALLYNMARCHEWLGQHERAIEIYNEYLKTQPDNIDTIEARIANLKKLIAQRKPAPPVTPQPAATVVPPETPAKPEEPVTPARDDGGPRPYRWPGWVLVAGGGALLVTGIVLGVKTLSKKSEAEQANRAGHEYADAKSIEDSGRTLQKATIGTIVAGAVVGASGAVLLILDARRPRRTERRSWLAPLIMPGGAGIVGEVRF